MTARTRNVMAAALVGAIATVTLGAGVARAQTAAEVAAANNPLAPITAINLQNYYVPTLYGSPDSTANSMLLRGVLGTESMIIRPRFPWPRSRGMARTTRASATSTSSTRSSSRGTARPSSGSVRSSSSPPRPTTPSAQASGSGRGGRRRSRAGAGSHGHRPRHVPPLLRELRLDRADHDERPRLPAERVRPGRRRVVPALDRRLELRPLRRHLERPLRGRGRKGLQGGKRGLQHLSRAPVHGPAQRRRSAGLQIFGGINIQFPKKNG